MGWIIGIGCFMAWLTHVFTCFATGAWGFLIAGALFFPWESCTACTCGLTDGRR